jgi:hypothetical protein
LEVLGAELDALAARPKSASVATAARALLLVLAMKTREQHFETADPVEAQRCRRAQYSGRGTALALSGTTVFGLVRSVKEEPGSKRWTVTIIPKEQKALPPRRPHKPSFTGG